MPEFFSNLRPCIATALSASVFAWPGWPCSSPGLIEQFGGDPVQAPIWSCLSSFQLVELF